MNKYNNIRDLQVNLGEDEKYIMYDPIKDLYYIFYKLNNDYYRGEFFTKIELKKIIQDKHRFDNIKKIGIEGLIRNYGSTSIQDITIFMDEIIPKLKEVSLEEFMKTKEELCLLEEIIS